MRGAFDGQMHQPAAQARCPADGGDEKGVAYEIAVAGQLLVIDGGGIDLVGVGLVRLRVVGRLPETGGCGAIHCVYWFTEMS
jgi:hypothetical protein